MAAVSPVSPWTPSPTCPSDVRTCLVWELDPVRARPGRACRARRRRRRRPGSPRSCWSGGRAGGCCTSTTSRPGSCSTRRRRTSPAPASFPTAPVERGRGAAGDRAGLRGVRRRRARPGADAGDGQGPAEAGRHPGGRVLRRAAARRRPTACLLPVGVPPAGRVQDRTGRTRGTRGCGSTCKSVLTWREEMEAALARLLGAVRPGRAAARGRRGRLAGAARPRRGSAVTATACRERADLVDPQHAGVRVAPRARGRAAARRRRSPRRPRRGRPGRRAARRRSGLVT